MTYADVSHARQLLGYSPQVSLASGVRRFLQWYSAYYSVDLPSSMAPTRRESAELRGKYDITAPRMSNGKPEKRRMMGGASLKRRMMQAGAGDA